MCSKNEIRKVHNLNKTTIWRERVFETAGRCDDSGLCTHHGQGLTSLEASKLALIDLKIVKSINYIHSLYPNSIPLKWSTNILRTKQTSTFSYFFVVFQFFR